MRLIDNPKLSIITINYNNGVGLLQTIQSVLAQTVQDFEYIIIDGNSSDESKLIIEQHANKLTAWVSEPDRGIYHAMNKGIQQASGTFLLFLNSGDMLKDNSALERASCHLNEADIVYSDLEVITDQGSHIQKHYDRLSFQYFLKASLPHPASFIKKSLFVRHGLYDESLKICADWKFFTEVICRQNASYKHIDDVWSTHFANGISSLKENRSLILEERRRYLNEAFSVFMSDYQTFEKQNKSKWVKLLKKLHLIK